jgi:hypothetical protein
MSNDIFVIANMADDPDASSTAGKADDDRIPPASAALGQSNLIALHI